MPADERLDPSFYRHWIEDRVRFADLDPLGHCNNAAIGGLFESSRVALFADAGYWAGGGAPSVPLLGLEIDLPRGVHYGPPGRVRAPVPRFGRTSFTLAGAVFDNEHCAATAQVVAVLFDLGRRRSVELTDDLRQALEAYA